MIRLVKSLSLLLIVCFISTYGQGLDPTICPAGSTPTPVDPLWRLSTQRFEIVTETTDGSKAFEVSQAFSTSRDSIAVVAGGLSTLLYWNFNTNEEFLIESYSIDGRADRACGRVLLDTNSETSVVVKNTSLIKPSVLLGFDPRNKKNVNWSIKFVNNSQIRGYPALKFTSCFFVTDIRATVSVDIYVLNEMLFNIQSADNQSIILQMDVRVKRADGQPESYTYNVFRYVPNPTRREQRQALETPAGVFCPGRTPGRPIPQNVPERVSSNNEALIPEAGASIVSTHGLYDTEVQFTRSDVWFVNPAAGSRWQHYTELHDFANGLRYQYNRTTRQCQVGDILKNSTDATTVPGQPNLIEMGTPQHFFLMDDIEYQYTGEKLCRDRVMCHVWIGEKKVDDTTFQHREWYWGYSIDDKEIEPWIPIKFVWKTYKNAVVVNSYEINIFNFRRNPFSIFEIDYTLADCYRALGPKNGYNLGVLTFVINNDKNYPVTQNLNYLRFHIWETLVFTMFVRPIRISQLLVDVVGNDIQVTFTLLDAPPKQGPVETIFNETSFDGLVDRLKTVLDSNSLFFRARANDRQVILRARPKSLNIAFTSTTNVETKSGGRITTFWIVFVIVGLVLGSVGAALIFKFFVKG